MITTLQAYKNELTDLKPVIDKFNPIIFLKDENKNSFDTFKELLEVDVDDYRLHFNGNISIVKDLDKNIPNLLKFMRSNNIFLLSLSAPSSKRIGMEYFIGKRIIDNTRIGFSELNNIGVIYSKEFIKVLRNNLNEVPNENETQYIKDVLKKTRLLSLLHLPLLVKPKDDADNNLFQYDFFINKK